MYDIVCITMIEDEGMAYDEWRDLEDTRKESDLEEEHQKQLAEIIRRHSWKSQ